MPIVHARAYYVKNKKTSYWTRYKIALYPILTSSEDPETNLRWPDKLLKNCHVYILKQSPGYKPGVVNYFVLYVSAHGDIFKIDRLTYSQWQIVYYPMLFPIAFSYPTHYKK